MANRESAFLEITPEVLLKAYACGIFVAENTEDEREFCVGKFFAQRYAQRFRELRRGLEQIEFGARIRRAPDTHPA